MRAPNESLEVLTGSTWYKSKATSVVTAVEQFTTALSSIHGVAQRAAVLIGHLR